MEVKQFATQPRRSGKNQTLNAGLSFAAKGSGEFLEADFRKSQTYTTQVQFQQSMVSQQNTYVRLSEYGDFKGKPELNYKPYSDNS
jgi:hypothetical protein